MSDQLPITNPVAVNMYQLHINELTLSLRIVKSLMKSDKTEVHQNVCNALANQLPDCQLQILIEEANWEGYEQEEERIRRDFEQAMREAQVKFFKEKCYDLDMSIFADFIGSQAARGCEDSEILMIAMGADPKL